MLDYIFDFILQHGKKRPPPVKVTWTREQVVEAMLDFVGVQWNQTLELAKERNLPDYERFRADYYIGDGSSPSSAKINDPDEPLTESNSQVGSWMFMKRAYIVDQSQEKWLRVWLWDINSLRPLKHEAWPKENEDPNFEYTLFEFRISDDLRKVWFGREYAFMAYFGHGLLVTEVSGQLKMINDPDSGFMQT